MQKLLEERIRHPSLVMARDYDNWCRLHGWIDVDTCLMSTLRMDRWKKTKEVIKKKSNMVELLKSYGGLSLVSSLSLISQVSLLSVAGAIVELYIDGFALLICEMC